MQRLSEKAEAAAALRRVKARLARACLAYLAGDPSAWAQAIEAQAEVAALRAIERAEAGR